LETLDSWQQTACTACDALQAVVRGRQPATSLNRLLDGVSYRRAVSEDDVHWRLHTPTGRTAAVRALLARYELRHTRLGRLRPCQNPECAVFLIDHSTPSKAGGARWPCAETA
jgi:predicted RNA-binding Zn ribbon-like protein